MATYAIVQTGGRQYRVQPGDVLDVEKLDGEVGSQVTLNDVRLVAKEDGLMLGTPQVDGARVVAEVQDQFRGPKIIVFKYKNKTHYRRKNGHRQSYTRLRVQEILTGAAPRRRSPSRRRAQPEEAVEPTEQETPPEPQAVEQESNS